MVPSMSSEAEASKSTVSGAVPPLVDCVNAAFGAVFGSSDTSICSCWVPTSPSSSVTVSVTVYVPASVYVACVVTPVAVVPLPRSHEYEVIVPSESVDVEPLRLTVYGMVPAVDTTRATAVGGTFGVGFTVMTCVAVPVSPSSSVTVSVVV